MDKETKGIGMRRRLTEISDKSKRTQVWNSLKLMALTFVAFMPAKRFSRLITIALLSLMLFSMQPLHAETSLDPNPLPKILQDWEKRGREISAVEYVLSGTRTWPRDGASFSAMVTGAFSATITLDFNRNRCRLESTIPDYAVDARQLYKIRTVHVGAGGKTAVRILENTDPDLKQKKIEDFLILKGNPEMIPPSRMGDGCFVPIFYASGVVPTSQHRVKTSNINPGLTPEAFVFEGYETNQGRPLAKLRLDYVQRFRQTNWFLVDLERDSAIVKTITQTGVATNGPLTIREIEYRLMNGFWMPSQWSAMWYGMGGELHEVEAISVTSVRQLAQVADDLFELSPSPGMKVLEIDHQLDPATQRLVVERNNYRLSAAGEVEQSSTTRTSVDVGRSVRD
jgi:hypothetical protein